MVRVKNPDGKKPSSKRGLDEAEEPLRKKAIADEPRVLAVADDPPVSDAEDEDQEEEEEEEVDEQGVARPPTPARLAKLKKINTARHRLRALRVIVAASKNSSNHVLQEVHIRDVIRHVIKNQPLDKDSNGKIRARQPCDMRVRGAAIERFRESTQAEMDDILQKSSFIMAATGAIYLTEAHVEAALQIASLSAAATNGSGSKAEDACDRWRAESRRLTGRKLKTKRSADAASVSVDA